MLRGPHLYSVYPLTLSLPLYSEGKMKTTLIRGQLLVIIKRDLVSGSFSHRAAEAPTSPTITVYQKEDKRLPNEAVNIPRPVVKPASARDYSSHANPLLLCVTNTLPLCLFSFFNFC